MASIEQLFNKHLEHRDRERVHCSIVKVVMDSAVKCMGN